jgi:sulfane dehydrogenase subunit SoxC
MTTTAQRLSEPARLASADEGISADELALAGRNHALLLEDMRHDVTPVGLHYVLVHYDVPDVPDVPDVSGVEADAWSLSVGGEVSTPLSLRLEQLRVLPAVSMPVTLECAGNGRAHLSPRPVSQPWLDR